MTEKNAPDRDEARAEQEEFMVDIDELVLHPALEQLKDLRTDRTEKYRKAPFHPAFPLPCFQILSEEDAEAAGQPEQVGTVLSGHELFQVAKERGISEWKACQAGIPAGTEPEEFVYKRFLDRLGYTFGQQAVVAGMLQQFYEDRMDGDEDVQEKARRRMMDEAFIEENLLRAGRKLVEEAPGLTRQVLRQELSIGDALKCLKDRSDGWTGPPLESLSMAGLLGVDSSDGESQMDLFLGKLQLQVRQIREQQD